MVEVENNYLQFGTFHQQQQTPAFTKVRNIDSKRLNWELCQSSVYPWGKTNSKVTDWPKKIRTCCYDEVDMDIALTLPL